MSVAVKWVMLATVKPAQVNCICLPSQFQSNLCFFPFFHRKYLLNDVTIINLDLDECTTSNDCDRNALCTNTEGSYLCRCIRGYEGDGRTCTGKAA